MQLLQKEQPGNPGLARLQKVFQQNKKAARWDLLKLFNTKKTKDGLREDLLNLGYGIFGPEEKRNGISSRSSFALVGSVYGATFLLALSCLAWGSISIYNIVNPPACPKYKSDASFKIAIDQFDKVNTSWTDWFSSETPEKQIYEQLRDHNIDVIQHDLNIGNHSDAARSASSCRMDMIIYGEVDYGPPLLSFLDYYINEEKYADYIIPLDEEEASDSEELSSIFALKRGRLVEEVSCAINLYLGLIHKEQNQLEEARNSFKQLIACTTNDSLLVLAHHLGAKMNLELKANEKAVEYYEEILEIDSADLLALRNLAKLEYDQGDYIEANQKLEAILEQRPNVNQIKLAHAQVLTKMNRADLARQEVEEVKQSRKYKRNPEKYKKAIEKTEEQLTAQPENVRPANDFASANSPSLNLNQALFYFNAGDLTKANQELDKLDDKLDTAKLSPAQYGVLRDIYSKLGEEQKVNHVEVQAQNKGIDLNRQSLRNVNLVKQDPIDR